jgi:hypothetical protein
MKDNMFLGNRRSQHSTLGKQTHLVYGRDGVLVVLLRTQKYDEADCGSEGSDSEKIQDATIQAQLE